MRVSARRTISPGDERDQFCTSRVGSIVPDDEVAHLIVRRDDRDQAARRSVEFISPGDTAQEGPKYLRWALIEAATHAARRFRTANRGRHLDGPGPYRLNR